MRGEASLRHTQSYGTSGQGQNQALQISAAVCRISAMVDIIGLDCADCWMILAIARVSQTLSFGSRFTLALIIFDQVREGGVLECCRSSVERGKICDWNVRC